MSRNDKRCVVPNRGSGEREVPDLGLARGVLADAQAPGAPRLPVDDAQGDGAAEALREGRGADLPDVLSGPPDRGPGPRRILAGREEETLQPPVCVAVRPHARDDLLPHVALVVREGVLPPDLGGKDLVESVVLAPMGDAGLDPERLRGIFVRRAAAG